MPHVKQRIGKEMKKEQNPLVYLEYTSCDKKSTMQICMGFVSRPYEETFRITTCRHLIMNEMGKIPSKLEILEGLEVYARYEGVNKKFHKLLFEDVEIKIHEDILADLLFIEITRPDNYNFQLLNQASSKCRRRFPGSQVYYFQHHENETYFRLFEGEISRKKIYVIAISNNGFCNYLNEKPIIHHRTFNTINTTNEILILGASGSPILSRRGEVIGMMCAHHQTLGRGIYMSIEKIERLYEEISSHHA